MDNNIGVNLQNYAKNTFNIGVISIVVIAIISAISISIDYDSWWIPLVIAPALISSLWVTCLFMYGFGQLIINTSSNTVKLETVTSNSPMGRLLAESATKTNTSKQAYTNNWTCLSCGKQNPKHIKECECGFKRAY